MDTLSGNSFPGQLFALQLLAGHQVGSEEPWATGVGPRISTVALPAVL